MSQWFNDKFPIVGLSPMDGITDEPFRLTQCHVAKPDVVFTEFVSAEGLSRGGVKLFDHLLYLPHERPIIAQLFGKDPDSFYKTALILCHLGFDGLDINMGCPAKTVIQHGSGAALIGKPALASEIIGAVQSAVADFAQNKVKLFQLKLKPKVLEIINRNQKYSDYILHITYYILPTISVKTRLGLTHSVIDRWIPHLLGHHLDFITLHGRTLKQGYAGVADWNEISKAVDITKSSSTLILGNGDIQNRQQGIEYCQKYQVAGVLIGRAAMGNPWVFKDYLPTLSEKFEAMKYHLETFSQVFPHRSIDSLRRHFLLYSSGHPHAKSLRKKIVTLSTLGQLLALEPDFISC